MEWSFSITITTVRRSERLGFAFGGGGCGTRASSPCGVSGVMTMKMMMSTSSTSIIGVILISDFGPLPDPTAIAIKLLLYEIPRAGGLFRGRRSALLIRILVVLDLFGEQTDLVDAGGAEVVDHGDDLLILRARVGP